ncbi:hypothetical protein [Sediminicola arcticus]|uniref:DUF4476 domain-containing protein n=1 Tax=Sediminicola arcticus TaxID=1574308 RepID=A0ABV2SPV1_9FLAO
MKIFKLITLLFICTASSIYGQEEDFEKYANALCKITTFADNKGFIEEVTLKDDDTQVKWERKNGYIFTTELDYIEIFAFKILYKKNDNYVVYVYQDPEGTAINYYIFDLTVKNNTVKLNKIIGGGDRCNNGVDIDEIKIEGEIITYAVHITPEEILTWFEKNKTFGCLECCFALATYDYNISTKKNTFKYIRLIKENININSKVLKVYNDFTEKRELKLSLTLNEKELKQFLKALE